MVGTGMVSGTIRGAAGERAATATEVIPRLRAESTEQGLATLLSIAQVQRRAAAAAPEPPPPARRPWYRLSPQALALAGLLTLQAALSMRLIWSNTAFNDEALYLWSGHWEIAHLLYGTKVPQFQAYFSGAPVIYPVIGAVADSYGGLAAARLLSLVFMLGVTGLLQATGDRLFGRPAGLIGAALFAVLGPVQFLGALATYDAMALFCLTLAAWLVVRASDRVSEPVLLILAALALAVGDATKYATALWDPVVIALAGLTAESWGWRRALARSGRLTAYTAAFLAVFLRFGGHPYLQGIFSDTLARSDSSTPAMGVFRDSAIWIGIVVLIAARAVVISPDTRTRLLSALLVGAALLAPFEQARLHTTTALQKHVAFGAWFAAIAAGWVLARAVQQSKYARWRIVFGTVLLVAVIGTIQAGYLHDSWPDSRPAVTAIKKAMAASPGLVLSEQGVVVNYYLHLAPTRVVDTFAFSYFDPQKHEFLHGTQAYLAALRNHYFSVVEIDGSYTRHAQVDRAITAAVEHDRGYQLVTATGWKSHSGHGMFMVWRYKDRR
jgi:Dolichyl-phosphate-mannose-protein mannosyltransferase